MDFPPKRTYLSSSPCPPLPRRAARHRPARHRPVTDSVSPSQLVTGFAQSLYYNITIRAGDPKPRPGTPRHAEHRRRIHILVVSLYLLYTIYEADFELRAAGNYYTDLGVSFNASEREVKSRFRRLAALYHPDKASTSDTSQADVNAYFVRLKSAADTLTDPAKRFAYERFGPDIVQWQHCVTIRDYVMRGAQVVIPYYGLAAAFLYGMGLLGYLDWGRFERWVVMVILCVFELHTITRPSRPVLFERVINPLVGLVAGRPPYLPFQAILLARKLCVTLYIAFSQIGPMLTADTSGGQVVVARQGGNEEELLRQGLERLETTVKALDVDTTRQLEMEMAPYAGDEEMLGKVRGKVKEWLVQNTIRADPMVRDALGRTFQKRRTDAPAGARGTR